MKKFFFMLGFAICCSTLSFGQSKVLPLIPDRPDYTNSPNVLPIGYTQIESGIYFSKDKIDIAGTSIETSSIGILSTLVRVGLADMFELRFGGEYLMQNVKTGPGEVNSKGLNALMVGTKFQFLSEAKGLFDAGLILEINLPFGSADFKPEKAEPRIYVSAGAALSKQVSLTGNFGTQYESSDNSYLNFYSLSCGVNLSNRFGFFVEEMAYFTINSNPQHIINAGINYLMRPNLMADFYFGKQISSDSNFWLMGAGFSYRLPD